MTEPRDSETLLSLADVIAEWLDALDVMAVTKKSYRCGPKALEEYAIENNLDLNALETADAVAFKKDLLTRLPPAQCRPISRA